MRSQNMGDASAVTEFMDYVYDAYPASHYSMIFWDHGGGAVIGYGADENYDYNILSLTELSEGIGSSQLADDTRLDYVGFDACLMGMAEVADAMSPYADYLIASEEVEAGDGWDYSCLKDITAHDAYEGDKAAEYIIDAYAAYYDSYGSYAPDYSLSCVDLNRMDDVVSSLEKLVSAADDELQQGGYQQIAKARDKVKSFGMVSPDSFYDYIDLGALADSLSAAFPKQAEDLNAALTDAVAVNGSNIADATGLSIYFPYQNKDYDEEWVAAYQQNDFSDIYTDFITDFAGTLNGSTLYEWDIAEVSPQQSDTASQYYIQLSEEEIANYASANASIWQPDDEDTYICWLNSKNVSLSEDGRLSAGFDGRIFYLNGEETSLPCCATEIERSDDYVKYAIPVILNMGSDDMQTAYIHVKTDDQHPDGYICGVYSVLDTESELYPDKNVIQIEEDDEITPFLFARDIVFNDDGSVAPFDSWASSSGIGSSMTAGSSFSVQLKTNEDQEDYICLFRITDTQGNRYFTNYLEMPYSSFQ